MPTYIKTLTDKDNNTILPKTRSTATYMENNETVENYASSIKKETAPLVHKNLLDNWDFTQPINQLETQKYTSVSPGQIWSSTPAIDRWRLVSGVENTVFLTCLPNEGIRLESANSSRYVYMQQYIYQDVLDYIDPNQRTVTFSMEITTASNQYIVGDLWGIRADNGESEKIETFFEQAAKKAGIYSGTLSIPSKFLNKQAYRSFLLSFGIMGNLIVKYVKLEIGSKSTLYKHDEVFDRPTELQKYMQYRRVLKSKDLSDNDVIALMTQESLISERPGKQSFRLEIQGPFRKKVTLSNIYKIGSGTFDIHSPYLNRAPIDPIPKGVQNLNNNDRIYILYDMLSGSFPYIYQTYDWYLKNSNGHAGIMIYLDDGN